MAIYGIRNNDGGAQLGAASRSAGLDQLRNLDASKARENLEGLKATLRSRDGSLKHGVLKMVNSSSATRQMGFARKNGIDRWFSQESTFQNTSSALRILLERSGIQSDRATALLAAYTERNGQIKYRNADRLLSDALAELRSANQFVSAAISLQTLAAGTGDEIIALTADKLEECGRQIEAHQRGSDPEAARKYYSGQDERLKHADRVMYLLEETNPFEWSDTHFQIIEKMGALLSSAPPSEQDVITGLKERYENFRNIDYPGAFRIREIERRISATASTLMESAEPNTADAIEILDGIDQLHHDPENFSILDKDTFLRGQTAAVMKAIHLVMTDTGVDQAAHGKAIEVQAALLETCSFLPSAREDSSVIEIAARSVAAKLPDVDPVGMYWMAAGLDRELSHGGSNLNQIAIGEKVVLFLHCVDKQAEPGNERAIPQATIDRIRKAYDEQAEIQAGSSYMKDVLDIDDPSYYIPMMTKGYGAVDRLIVCSKAHFESWITGNPIPPKESVDVLRMQVGQVVPSAHADVESDRFEGIASVGLFMNGQEKVYPRRIQPAIDYILSQGGDDDSLKALFDGGLKGKKDKSLSETAVRNKIAPVFDGIWGKEVVSDDPSTWDRVEILNKDAHFAGLKAAMPTELGETREAFSRFLFNLSSVVTKLGSAEIWGDEGSSVSSLRLYGYLLMEKAFEENPQLLDQEARATLERGYKDVNKCAQILSNDQMAEGNEMDSAAFKLIVPTTLTRQ